MMVDTFYTNQVQFNSVETNPVVNEHSVITNRFTSQIGHFSTQINPLITSPYSYNEQKWTAPGCSLKPSLTVTMLAFQSPD